MQSKYNIIEPARFLKKWCKEYYDNFKNIFSKKQAIKIL